MPCGIPDPPTPEHHRHILTDLLAAFNIGRTAAIDSSQHRRHARQFCELLDATTNAAPATLEIHVMSDDRGIRSTRTVCAWLEHHPRVHMHVVPSNAWINQAAPLLSALTDTFMRGAVAAAETFDAALCRWSETWDAHPTTFVWTHQ
jgi:hypothetical protein